MRLNENAIPKTSFEVDIEKIRERGCAPQKIPSHQHIVSLIMWVRIVVGELKAKVQCLPINQSSFLQ